MSTETKSQGFSTRQLHAGYTPDQTGATAVPIYASTSFVFKNAQHGEDIFSLNSMDWVYTRVMNPTVAAFEARVAALEGGLGAVATASGQAAQFLTFSALTTIGDNIVASGALYPGSVTQLKVLLAQYGVEVRFVPIDQLTNLKSFASLIDDRTRAIYVEAISNPTCIVAPIPALATLAHDHGIPLVVDNTFGAGGFLLNPIEHGADIVTHSATKWIGGHGTTMGGVIVDSGKFDWTKGKDKFLSYTTPLEMFGNKSYVEKFGPFSFLIKIRVEYLMDIGPCMDPFAAFELLKGLETLSVRVRQQCQNAASLAKYLSQHPKVAWVNYLGHPEHPSHDFANEVFRKDRGTTHYTGMVCFGVKGGDAETRTVIDNLKLASHLANVGDSRTLVIWPARTQGLALTPDQVENAGLKREMLRVSVGLEDIEDIVADFEAALALVGSEIAKSSL